MAPPAPAGYIGDGVTLHKVVGAPYSPDGITPANYFQINDSTGTQVGKTSVFSVVGKLQGPLEADPAKGDLGVVPIGTTSPTQTMLLKNTGITPLTITSASVAGTGRGATSPRPRRPASAPPWRRARTARCR